MGTFTVDAPDQLAQTGQKDKQGQPPRRFLTHHYRQQNCGRTHRGTVSLNLSDEHRPPVPVEPIGEWTPEWSSSGIALGIQLLEPEATERQRHHSLMATTDTGQTGFVLKREDGARLPRASRAGTSIRPYREPEQYGTELSPPADGARLTKPARPVNAGRIIVMDASSDVQWRGVYWVDVGELKPLRVPPCLPSRDAERVTSSKGRLSS